MATKTKARKSAKGPAATARTEDRSYRAAKIYKAAKTVALKELPAEYVRADLEFIGVEHAGASYEARVYVNNPTADVNTEPTEGNGYAGSFYVFGHGGCFGDAGHCDVWRALRHWRQRRHARQSRKGGSRSDPPSYSPQSPCWLSEARAKPAG